MGYTVTAPLVLVRNDEGATTYHYEGVVLPSYVAHEDVQRLLADGMIARTDLPAPVVPTMVEQDDSRDDEQDDDVLDRPAKAAPKEAWVDYAVSKGADRQDADASTKQDLIDLYGGD